MDSNYLSLVDTDLKQAVQLMKEPVLSKKNLHEYRNAVLSHAKKEIDPQLDVTIEKHIVPTKNNEVPILLFRPRTTNNHEPMPVYLYMHGGGMVSGGAHLDNMDNAKLSHELQCIVISIEYRLAPETIFPGQLEDSYAVLTWVKKSAKYLNIDSTRIAVGGSSAGGGLAASLSQLALDRGEVEIIFQNLHIPMLDDRTVFENPSKPYAGQLGWTQQMNAFAWEMYLGHPAPSSHPKPYAVPARRKNLEHLPSTLITIGSLDLFLGEVLNYGQRLIDAGVHTEMHIYPGLYHLGELVPNTRVKNKIFNDRLDAFKRAFYD